MDRCITICKVQLLLTTNIHDLLTFVICKRELYCNVYNLSPFINDILPFVIDKWGLIVKYEMVHAENVEVNIAKTLM